jgi:hypothetical protein
LGIGVVSWTQFVLSLSGSFYVLMTGSLVLHEVFGHGLMSLLCGSRGITFAVTPGFAGWAAGTDPADPAKAWVIRYAGIAVNMTLGLLVLGVLRLRPPRLSPAGLALFWLGTTELGHALGYTLQGLVFRQGDAASLPEVLGPVGRIVAILVVSGLFVVFALWALSGAAGFVRDHFLSPSPAAFRRDFILAFTLPMASVILWAPGLPRREFWTVAAFDVAVLVVLVLVTAWSVRRLPTPRDPPGTPISGGWATGWALLAIAAFGATHFWLSRGVTFYFRQP